MGRHLEIRPRDAWTIRNAMAVQVAAHVLAALPIGYWQRRVAARAWSLETMPVIPRESQQIRAWRLPGPPAIWVLATEVMIWGLVPWVWRADARTEVTEARRALRQFTRMASRPACAAIFITAADVADPRLHLPRLRMSPSLASAAIGDGGLPAFGPMPVGVITWSELGEVFTEAATEANSLRGRDAATYGARQLERLAQTSSA